jgi:catecholate siderophore receptor
MRDLSRLGTGPGADGRTRHVTLPAYTRVDAALFFAVTSRTRLQLNVENLLDAGYYLNADSNI